MSYWEMAISYFATWDIPSALDCWKHLAAEATWSKAVYAYGAAVSLLQIGGEENYKEAEQFFAKVPTLMQRIAGKSIPLEVSSARMFPYSIRIFKANVLHCRNLSPAKRVNSNHKATDSFSPPSN